MCEPMTIMAATSVLSAGFTATQALRQGKAQEGIAKYNARVAENKAQETLNAGVEQENAKRQATAELISKQRAQLGASGIDLDSGSALQLQQDAQQLGEVDALRIRSNAQGQAAALSTKADLTLLEGTNARKAGQSKAFSSLLGGVSSALGTGVADKWFTPASSALQGA